MNRDEILKRSREERNDEGELHARKVGESWGFAGMVILYAVLYFVTLLVNEEKMYLLQPAGTLFFTGYGLQKLGFGLKAKKKEEIIFGILWLLLGIGHLYLYFKEIMG